MAKDYKTLLDDVIKAEIAGTPHRELVLPICDTPNCLLDCGYAQHKIVIKATNVGKIFYEHALTQDQIGRIGEMLEKPQAIYRSASRPDSVVVFTFEFHGASPIIIPVAEDQQIGRGPLVHEVPSMYGVQGPDPRPRWERQGLLIKKF